MTEHEPGWLTGKINEPYRPPSICKQPTPTPGVFDYSEAKYGTPQSDPQAKCICTPDCTPEEDKMTERSSLLEKALALACEAYQLELDDCPRRNPGFVVPDCAGCETPWYPKAAHCWQLYFIEQAEGSDEH